MSRGIEKDILLKVLASSLFVLLPCSSNAIAGEGNTASWPRIEQVSIRSGWGGLSDLSPVITELKITPVGDGYEMTGRHSEAGKGKELPPIRIASEDVDRLVDALAEGSQPLFSLADLGIPLERVEKQVDSSLTLDDDEKPDPGVVEKIAAYRESLVDRDALAETLTKGFPGFHHTDDYPGAWVEAKLADGTVLSATTESQMYLMLPWERKGKIPTYSPHISAALRQLLPEQDANKERLASPIDAGSLEELVDAALSEKVQRVQAEGLAGAALNMLENDFIVSDAKAQMPYPSLKLGKLLFASLQLPESPSNLKMSVRLSLRGDALEAPGEDIGRVRAALALVQSSPAMLARIHENSDEEFRIQDNFGYAWLNKASSEQFVQQMKQLGKLPELQSNPTLMQGAVMVQEGRSPIFWIVLSDRRAVMWKEFTNAKATEGTMRCESLPSGDDDEFMRGMEDHSKSDLCIGRVFSVEGGKLK